ncbi:MAG: D-alanine--D-alanine ligase [Desulfobacteraceae bacterium]|nr:D-alanine--D-alanine ligase [Desulfobacteraceae bacterium]
MRVAIIHNNPSQDGDLSETDVMRQVRLVGKALDELGATHAAIPVTRALGRFLDDVYGFGPDVAFNLAESVDGRDELHPNVPAVLELIDIPCTGSPAGSLWLTTDKVIAKEIMQARDIPTPEFWTYKGPLHSHQAGQNHAKGPWIVKPAAKDASIDIDEGAVFSSLDDLVEGLPERWARLGQEPLLIERYIHGREFGVSMLEGPGGVECLPPAEIVFCNYKEGTPRIVDWRAKWDPLAPSYQNTVRSFDLQPADGLLIEELKELAMRCWNAFRLKGYARVDLRVDEMKRPWVLEINANPCLSDDAGFMAAAMENGLMPKDIIRRILEAARPA